MHHMGVAMKHAFDVAKVALPGQNPGQSMPIARTAAYQGVQQAWVGIKELLQQPSASEFGHNLSLNVGCVGQRRGIVRTRLYKRLGCQMIQAVPTGFHTRQLGLLDQHHAHATLRQHIRQQRPGKVQRRSPPHRSQSTVWVEEALADLWAIPYNPYSPHSKRVFGTSTTCLPGVKIPGSYEVPQDIT